MVIVNVYQVELVIIPSSHYYHHQYFDQCLCQSATIAIAIVALSIVVLSR